MCSKISAAIICSAFAFAIVAVSAGPMGMGGPGGRDERGGPGGPGGPFKELERNLTSDQKQQLEAIFKNESATKQQIQDSLKAFFQGIGGDVATKFSELQTSMEAKKAEMETKMASETSTLSDAASQLLSQMKAIKENQGITMAQEKEQIKALFDGASEEVKSELKSSAKFPMGGTMSGGPMMHGGHHFTTVSA